MTILKTRLFKPPVSNGYLPRQRLLDKMTENHYKPVHLLVAAAGYGKSVFISQWLDEIDSGYCWISLEEDCNDIRTFLTYLGEAICSKLMSPDCDMLQLAKALELPNLIEISRVVINELQSIDKQIVVVFDDYHQIKEQAVHDLMSELIKSFPKKHKIIITSRFDPPINLTKLKAYDKVNEIRMADLCFSLEEINELATKLFCERLEQEALVSILKLTEGWIVPIRLILKDFFKRRTTEVVYGINQNTGEKVTAYLLEELFKHEHPMLKESLMQASLFPMFNIKMLISLFINEHPDEEPKQAELEHMIRQFTQQSLFIIPLDNDNNWFRFHHLVQEFLDNRIKQKMLLTKISKVLVQGSIFFEANDSIDEAILLCVQAKEYELAASIFDRHRHKLLNEHRLDVLRKWLGMIPVEIVDEHPGLLLTRAALFETTQNTVDMLKDLRRAEELLKAFNDQSDKSSLLRGEFYSLLTSSAALSGDMKMALESAAKAEELLEVEHEYLRYFSMAYRVLVLNAVGRGVEAMEILLKDRKKLSVFQKRSRMSNHILSVLLRFDMGQVDSYLYDAHEARKLAEEISDNTAVVYANYFLAVSAYVKNDLEQVLPDIENVLSNKYSSRPFWVLHSYFVKGIYLLAVGQSAAFESCAIELVEYAMKFPSPYLYNTALIMQTELYLRQGKIKKAREVSKKVNFDSFDIVLPYHLTKLVEVKLLLADKQSGQLDRAAELIQKFDEIARITNNNNFLYQVHCLEVLLLARRNKTSEALNLLRQSLSATKKEGFVRIYTDHGAEMKMLVDQLHEEEKSDPYAQVIIGSFNPVGNHPLSHNQLDLPQGGHVFVNAKGARMKITAREQKLLIQLSKGLQNKEIAELIHVAPNSVKTSLYRLYRKLKVNNRQEAIGKAAELGILALPVIQPSKL